jgi:TPR repeat protein
MADLAAELATTGLEAHLQQRAVDRDAEAMTAVGDCYYHGTGGVVAADRARAAAWYGRAADAGDFEAMCKLGDCYAHGHGVGADGAAAITWYTRAAVAGHRRSMVALSGCYRDGRGVAQDLAQAARWYRRAAEVGHPDAMADLGDQLARGSDGQQQDVAAATRWYRRAADAGHPGAMASLGECYSRGRGVPVDVQRAFVWFRRAADAGHPGGMYYLGCCYEAGTGVKRDHATAVGWYRHAATGGDAKALHRLGLCYEQGELGIPRSLPDALQLYQQAARAAPPGFASPREHAARLEAQGVQPAAPIIILNNNNNTADTDVAAQAIPAAVPAPVPAPVPVPVPVPVDQQRELEQAAEAARAAAERERRQRKAYRDIRETVQATWSAHLPSLDTCVLCLDPLAGGGDNVRLGGCNHAVCLRCRAEQTVPPHGDYPDVMCPACGGHTPRAQLASNSTLLPLPLLLHPVVEQDHAPPPQLCVRCADEDPDASIAATYACSTCSSALCDDHARLHVRLPRFSSHTVVAVVAAPALCADHGLPYHAVCTAPSCNVAICTLCLTTTHPPPGTAAVADGDTVLKSARAGSHHRPVALDTALVDRCRKRLVAAATAATERAAQLLQRGADLAMLRADADARDAELTHRVHVIFAGLRAVLEQRERLLLGHLANHAAAERAALQLLEDEAMVLWRQLHAATIVALRLAAPCEPPPQVAPAAAEATGAPEPSSQGDPNVDDARAASTTVPVPPSSPLPPPPTVAAVTAAAAAAAAAAPVPAHVLAMLEPASTERLRVLAAVPLAAPTLPPLTAVRLDVRLALEQEARRAGMLVRDSA